MATKRCANGHQYDAAIYGDQCPYCPKPETTVVMPKTEQTAVMSEQTVVMGEQTVVMNEQPGRKMIGVLVTYDTNPLGEVHKVYEGANELTIDGKKFHFLYIPQ